MSNSTSDRGLKLASILSFVFVAPALAYYMYQNMQAPITTECDLFFSGNVIIRSVPLADSPAKIRRGLSGEGGGSKMLFVWNEEAVRSFWMKDTPINLSIGFFDKDGILYKIIDMEAMTKEKHSSKTPTLYALELAQGQFQLKGLELRSSLIRKECRAL